MLIFVFPVLLWLSFVIYLPGQGSVPKKHEHTLSNSMNNGDIKKIG